MTTVAGTNGNGDHAVKDAGQAVNHGITIRSWPDLAGLFDAIGRAHPDAPWSPLVDRIALAVMDAEIPDGGTLGVRWDDDSASAAETGEAA